MKNFQQYKSSYLFLVTVLFLSSTHFACKKTAKPGPETPIDTVKVVDYSLPQISINSIDSIKDDPKVNGTITISQLDKMSFDGFLGIEYRGATSQSFPKKAYGIEIRDTNNEDLSVSLLGLPTEEDWILYAPYSDKSLMRNVLIYDLARKIGGYASRTKFVELTVNKDYKGVYVFMEKLKRNENRINITKLKSSGNGGEDVTGGYILKIDKLAGNNLGSGYNNDNSFSSSIKPTGASGNQKIRFLYEYPKAEDITTAQKTYISKYLGDFETALSSTTFTSSATGYSSYIDVPSFIDFFLLNELSNNVDGYRLSTYLNKDKNGKLKAGPIWDFNLAFGNANYCGGNKTDVWAYKFNDRCSTDGNLVPFWWGRLLEDPAYVTKLKARWNELKSGPIAPNALLANVDGYATKLARAKVIDKNFTKWPVLGVYVWPNAFIGTTYESETGYLKTWITNRITWMDGAISEL